MTDRPDWSALARQSPALAVLPLATRRRSAMRRFAPGESVFLRGDRPDFIYFVAEGEVRLLRTSRGGQPVVLQRARNGFLAEASLQQSAYHCDAVSIGPSLLLAIPRNAMLSALNDTGFRDAWIALLSAELRRVRLQNERLALRHAEQRVLHYIETEGDGLSVELGQTRKDWAAELGLTHEALYRTLASMNRRRLLQVAGSRLTVIGRVAG